MKFYNSRWCIATEKHESKAHQLHNALKLYTTTCKLNPIDDNANFSRWSGFQTLAIVLIYESRKLLVTLLE